MRPHPAFALAMLSGLLAAACSAEYASPTPTSPDSRVVSGLLFDEPLPSPEGVAAVTDLTEQLRERGAFNLTSVRIGRRTHLTIMVSNPFDFDIGELKIIIIDNPTTRSFGPRSLPAGESVVFSGTVNSPHPPGHVRVLGSLP